MSKITRVVREREGEKHPTRYYSKRQEDQIAEKTGGRRNANSGATMFGGKSDVSVINNLSIECKTRVHHCDSISLKKEWFNKMKKEALSDGHDYAVLAFNFGPDEPNYYVLDEKTFLEFLDSLKK